MELERLFQEVSLADPELVAKLVESVRTAESSQVQDPLELLLIAASLPVHEGDVDDERISRYSVTVARELAALLINAEGKLERERLKRALELLRTQLHCLGVPEIGPVREHLFEVLELFERDASLAILLMRFTVPLANGCAAHLIRRTLKLDEREKIKDVDVRRAILSALLTLFRQKIGSCFATAPALIVHREHVGVFLGDMNELLNRGFLRRTIAGIQQEVPLCDFRAVGSDENALLRSWEYTLASFAESRGGMTPWNLYTSLGFDPQIPRHALSGGGLGDRIRDILQSHLERLHGEVGRLDVDYERIASQAALIESRIDLDRSLHNLYQVQQLELHRLALDREDIADKARRIAGLLSTVIGFYTERIPNYFQEVFDPELIASGMHLADRPAGFRLFYKHGWRDPSLWKRIDSEASFIEALSSFFIATEPELGRESALKGLESLSAELVTSIVSYLRTQEFLTFTWEAARSNRAAGVVTRTPWSYISGGNLHSLMEAYLPLTAQRGHIEIYPDQPQELAAFFIDVAKELPLSLHEAGMRDPMLSLVAYSPRHAFLYKPMWLEKARCSPYHTTIWLRQNLIDPYRAFWLQQLDVERIRVLIDRIERTIIPPDFRTHFRQITSFSESMTPPIFRRELMGLLSYEPWMRDDAMKAYFLRALDALLHQALPILSREQIALSLPTVMAAMDELDPYACEQMEAFFRKKERELIGHFLSCDEWIGVLEGLFIMHHRRSTWTFSFAQRARLALQRCALAAPAPLLFGDSNWPNCVLGFVVGLSQDTISSGSSGSDSLMPALEIWGFNNDGRAVLPLHEWDSDYYTPSQPWGIYTQRI